MLQKALTKPERIFCKLCVPLYRGRNTSVYSRKHFDSPSRAAQSERLHIDSGDRVSNADYSGSRADSIELPSVCVSLDEEKIKLIDFNNTLQTENFEERIKCKYACHELMGKLLPIEQKIIYLRYLCDFGQAETALKLDLSQSTISKYEKRALLRMRRIVSEE